MGSSVHFDGAILIDPPVPWSLIRESRWIKEGHPNEAMLRVVEDTVHTEDGYSKRFTATAIISAQEDEARDREFVEQVQQIVDLVGDGHTFTGHIQVDCPDYMEQYRVYVKNGRAVRVAPIITWPEP